MDETDGYIENNSSYNPEYMEEDCNDNNFFDGISFMYDDSEDNSLHQQACILEMVHAYDMG